MGKFYESIIHVPDLQEPFSHPDSYLFLSAIKSEFWVNNKKSRCVNAGDEVDFHAFQQKYPQDPDGMSAGFELEAAINRLKMLWDLFPEQDVCISNHLIRPYITAFNCGLPRGFLREYAELLQAPKSVFWRDHFVHNNITFEHGDAGQGGQAAAINAAKANGMSTAIGHVHAWAGVTWYANRTKMIFGLNSGCLIDTKAYAFKYAMRNRSKVTLGASVILDCVPYFIPMLLNGDGRWVKSLPLL